MQPLMPSDLPGGLKFESGRESGGPSNSGELLRRKFPLMSSFYVRCRTNYVFDTGRKREQRIYQER
ncbi:MAG: hypothetical protein DMG71_11845 [Acidobacteria bacterium]|nr:MAG: hypothetical protein DMG71_11845 [Acidobacteriota bacterium]